MSKFIDFKPQDAKLPTFVRFSITKGAYASILNAGKDPLVLLKTLSSSRVILMTKGRQADRFEANTADGVFFCTIPSGNDALLIIGYNQGNLMQQNNALKNGVCFQVSQGIIVQIKLTEPYGLYFDIQNGYAYSDNHCANVSVSSSLSLISSSMAACEDRRTEDEQADEQEYRPEKKLANLLSVAEHYSILSSQLEERNATMLGKMAYSSIEAVEYDRVDRVSYQFGVGKLDENIFKVGAQVEIEDSTAQPHNAEITQLIKEDEDSPATALILLFNEHIDIGAFHQSGWFNVSFSTVNRDVQLKANEKIKTGTAAAKYMDAVFGKGQSGGFAQKNLSKVRETLLQKKYPPNDSQMNAIFSGINTRDVFLVMGPPGTGKTTVILEWVKYFVTQEHKRVLVSSQNNKAVDNVLARIAEEKDIDIIRIGSEAKLQSEVVPYMFENKVKGLRENIAQVSQQHLGDIKMIQQVWRDYSAQVNQYYTLVQTVNLQKRKFRNTVTQQLAPMHQQLSDLLLTHQVVADQRIQLATTIHALSDKLLDYEEHSRGVMRMIKYFPYKGNLSQMTALLPKYDALKVHEVALVQEYNVLRGHYQQVYELTRDTAFATLIASIGQMTRAQSHLVSQTPNLKQDIWGLFRTPRQLAIRSTLDILQLIQAIQNSLTQADHLAQAIGLWEEEATSRQNYALNEIVLESVNLVGATCIGINSQKRFANLDFDVTIIDEAGQIQVHNALVPMSVSNKLIMLGDHKQIPPSADQELMDLCDENGVRHDLLEKSLFEQMYMELPERNKMMLDTQYRMPAEIADTISEWFYQGNYYSPPFKQSLPSQIPALFSSPYVIIDTSAEGNRFERKIEGAGSSNALEAKIITDLIAFIAQTPDSDLKEIGVISAYKSQVKLIKNGITRFLPKELVGEMVATLDSYQGQERDIILYSFTKSAPSSPRVRRIGFLNELRRLNVAMTRCKKMLVLVGDMSFLGGCQHCDKTESGELVYEKSEKQFSDFINKMVADVKGGRGEYISYQALRQRMNGGE